MNILRRCAFAQLFIFVIALTVFGQTESDFKNLTDEELVLRLSSSNDKEASQAAVEIVRRGERIIGLLLKLKNSKQIYKGIDCLKNPDDFIFDSNDITIEVVALYLISAIYYDNIAFANAPYLTTPKKKAEDYTLNKPERIKKAWRATEKWYRKLQKIGLKELRETDEFPLKSGEIHFYGTNPKRKQDSSICGK